jgi:hypothetical protein
MIFFFLPVSSSVVVSDFSFCRVRSSSIVGEVVMHVYLYRRQYCDRRVRRIKKYENCLARLALEFGNIFWRVEIRS